MWDYTCIKNTDLQALLDECAESYGWELVNTMWVYAGNGYGTYVAVLKRRL